jgi:glycerol-3-phosphate dehydrogenase (NAD(P)+)
MDTNSKPSSEKEWVGVIGAGSFGTAISNLLAQNKRVLLYVRRQEVAEEIRRTRRNLNVELHPDVIPTTTLTEIADRCSLIFPIVPSSAFRKMMRELGPHLRPDHIVIHGTKGLDVILDEGETLETVSKLRAGQVKTMSEVIAEESNAVRIGCIAGPNLAREIFAGQPAATVVASRFEEVIREGHTALRTPLFRVHGNHNILGIELAGVLKNIMAIASGVLAGLDFGFNTRALLLTRGMAEMVYLGQGLGVGSSAFFGLAGIGDMIATCSSSDSRNFSVGYRLAKGEKLDAILATMTEVAEGVKTTRIAKALADQYKIGAPITRTMYKVLFEDMEVEYGIRLLMEFRFTEDVEFLRLTHGERD